MKIYFVELSPHSDCMEFNVVCREEHESGYTLKSIVSTHLTPAEAREAAIALRKNRDERVENLQQQVNWAKEFLSALDDGCGYDTY